MQYNLKFLLSQSRTQRRRADNPFINVVVGSFFVNKVILSAQRYNKKTVVSAAGYSCAKTKYSSLTAVLK